MQDGQANSHFGETFVGVRGFEPIATSSLQVEWETDPPCGTIAYPWEGDGEESVVYIPHGQGEHNGLETEIPPEKVLKAEIEGQGVLVHGQEAHHVLEPHLPPEKMLVAAPGEVIGQSASEIPLVLHVSKEDIWACPACLGIWVAEDLPYTQARIKEMPQTAPFWSGVKCLFCGGCRFTHPGTSETSWQGKWRPYLCTTIFEYVGSHAFWEAHTRKYVLTLPPLFGTTPAYMGWEIRLPSWLENPWHFDLHDPRVRRYPDSFSSPHCTVTARVTCTDGYTKGLGFLAVTFEQDETDQAPTLSGYVKWYAQMDPESVQGGGLSPLLPGIRRVYMIQVEWGEDDQEDGRNPPLLLPPPEPEFAGPENSPQGDWATEFDPFGYEEAPYSERGGDNEQVFAALESQHFLPIEAPPPAYTSDTSENAPYLDREDGGWPQDHLVDAEGSPQDVPPPGQPWDGVPMQYPGSPRLPPSIMDAPASPLVGGGGSHVHLMDGSPMQMDSPAQGGDAAHVNWEIRVPELERWMQAQIQGLHDQWGRHARNLDAWQHAMHQSAQNQENSLTESQNWAGVTTIWKEKN